MPYLQVAFLGFMTVMLLFVLKDILQSGYIGGRLKIHKKNRPTEYYLIVSFMFIMTSTIGLLFLGGAYWLFTR